MSEHKYLYSSKLQGKFVECLEKYNIDNVIYVGLVPANIFRAPNQLWWDGLCKSKNISSIIIEIFKPWAEELSKEGFNVVCSDIGDYYPPEGNNLLLWSHGPEHIDKNDFKNFMSKLLPLYSNIIVAMPYGIWEQTSAVNPYEEHLWHAYPEDLIDLGFAYVDTNGPKDNKGDLFGVYYD